ncbi:CAZyme family GH76 [Penicillium angulare]|uniref:CAZyme family GH76 n=1 Tax=Penicillium angulare TaxID=116970 RepID=UPI0025408E7B|nr:CAZyme family GH76 [Penicillium angulare]KAJ5291810.1 CAZyme family GH76 [Penicillium angulare]
MLFSAGRLFVPALTASLLLPCVSLAEDPKSRAVIALDALQEWYNTTSGLWDTVGWWNGANCMTTIADLAAIDPSAMETADFVFNNTFLNAPSSNPNPGPETRTNTKRNVLTTRANNAGNSSQWLDSAYDDDGWWALAWIAAYDVTEENSYLDLAEGIFASLADTWGTRCGNGGIYWSTSSSYINAITNELFLSIAAHLSNRVPSRKEFYVSWAQKEWNWFAAQGFIAANNTINDGLTDSCENNAQTVWSYNQGVVLGGLVELNKAAPNSSYLESANKIAKAAIETLADTSGVIHEACEPNNCQPDATVFKGVFLRNLQMLQSASPHDIYKKTINDCANSIWENDRNSQNELGVVWSGPVVSTVDPSTQSSAMDALVAALAL